MGWDDRAIVMEERRRHGVALPFSQAWRRRQQQVGEGAEGGEEGLQDNGRPSTGLPSDCPHILFLRDYVSRKRGSVVIGIEKWRYSAKDWRFACLSRARRRIGR